LKLYLLSEQVYAFFLLIKFQVLQIRICGQVI
jgi:hypothetical protein